MADDAESLGLELLPIDDELVSDDDDLQAAVDSALADPDDNEVEEQVKVFGRTWAYDFLEGTFRKQGNEPVVVSDEEALKVWMENSIRTARFAHAVYSDEFGTVRPNELIGRLIPLSALGVYGDQVTEGLLVHDRITSVQDFTGTYDDDTQLISISFVVTLDDESIVPFQLEVPA